MQIKKKKEKNKIEKLAQIHHRNDHSFNQSHRIPKFSFKRS